MLTESQIEQVADVVLLRHDVAPDARSQVRQVLIDGIHEAIIEARRSAPYAPKRACPVEPDGDILFA